MKTSTAFQIPEQVPQVMDLLHRHLPEKLIGVYLFGSSVEGGLRPSSDIDILAVVSAPLSEKTRESLVADLLLLSGASSTGPGRPLEITLVVQDDVLPWRYPPKRELQFGEWLRDALCAGHIPAPAFDPDLAILLTSVRHTSLALLGAPAHKLFDPVPASDLREAIAEMLPEWMSAWREDTRNVVLALARMWMTLVTGTVAPKDIAAQWLLERLPEEYRPVLDMARAAYLGESEDDWSGSMTQLGAWIANAQRAILRLLGPGESASH